LRYFRAVRAPKSPMSADPFSRLREVSDWSP
jgi:hypothetical protein